MMSEESDKLVIFDADTRDRLLRGVNTLADAVKVTMGPRGRNVIIEQPGQHPILTKDGVTVARAINLRDRVANLGAQMIKEAASRTADEAGDGTTTSTVLTQAIYAEGLKMLAAGYSASDLKKGIDVAVDVALAEISRLSSPVSGKDDLLRVATVSANGEKELGQLIASAIETVGQDGVVTVEEAKGFNSSLNVVSGARLDRGYLSPYFVTNQDRMVCELDKPVVLVLNARLDTLRDITGFLERILAAKRPLLIICEDLDGEALQGLVVNKLKGILNVCAVRLPGLGESRYDFAQDLATLLGTSVFHSSDIQSLGSVQLDALGACTRVVVSKSETILIGAKGNQESYADRIAEIRSRAAETPEDDEREHCKRRLALLSGGVAVLRVGGATEAELRERKDRVDDALHATQAALKEGIVPGGGVALARASSLLGAMTGTGPEAAGRQVVRQACCMPLRQIVANSGGVPDIVLSHVLSGPDRQGYNAYTEAYGDMLEMGIIDPTRVVKCALRNAASAAGMMLTAGCSIVEDDATQPNT
jgi:chaperonin GroEL